MAYPTSVATDADLYLTKNQLATQLDGSIDASQTTITVDSTTGFPTVGVVTIDSEVIKYTGTTATQFTGCTRGFDGTGATTHMDNAPVRHAVTAIHHNALKDEVIAIENHLDSVKAQFGFKNRIHNGDCRIDQIQAGTSSDASNGVSGTGPDGIYTVVTNSTAVVRIATHVDTPPTNFTHYMRLTCITADASIAATDQVFFDRNLEGLATADCNFGSSTARTLTFSFYVRSTLTGTYTGAFENHDQNRSYPFEYTINVADTWERKTITFTGDTTGTWFEGSTEIGIRIRMALAIGSTYQGTANSWQAGQFLGTANQVNFVSSNTSRTLDFSGFQLELGSVATPYEWLPYQTTLERCQRYYEKSYEVGTKPGTNTSVGLESQTATQTNTNTMRTGFVSFKVMKRAIPTLSVYTASGTLGSWAWTSTADVNTNRVVDSPNTNLRGFTLRQTVTSAEHYASGHWVADCRFS